MKQDLFRFPTPFIYTELLEEHDNIKDYILENVLDDIELNGEDYMRKMGGDWDCDMVSSYWRDTPLTFMNQKLYDTIVWQPLVRALNLLINTDTNEAAPQNPQLKEFWYNKYRPGQYQEVHDHMVPGDRHTTYSGIYILQMEADEENPTTFYYDHVPCHNNGGRPLQYRTGDLGEGHVIIFPSDLMHYVKPAKHDRITISFNIISEV